MMLPKEPTLVIVKVPPAVSSGFNLLFLAEFARLFTCLVNPTRFSWSAFFITGTIRFPLGRAVAIPMFMSFFTISLSPSKLLFNQGYFLMHFTTASMKSGVSVIFSFSRFSNSFFIRLLQCTRFVTSDSEKLVTCGLVCLLFTMCCAMSLRIRSISTISTLPL